MDGVCGLRQPGLVPEDDLVETRAGFGFGCQGLLDGGDRLGLRPLCGSQSLANVDTYRYTARSRHRARPLSHRVSAIASVTAAVGHHGTPLAPETALEQLFERWA